MKVRSECVNVKLRIFTRFSVAKANAEHGRGNIVFCCEIMSYNLI